METKLFRIPFIIDRSTYGTSALILIGSASLSLIAVGRRLAQLDLLAAMKAPE
jgi:putative ABC transport system permease protein